MATKEQNVQVYKYSLQDCYVTALIEHRRKRYWPFIQIPLLFSFCVRRLRHYLINLSTEKVISGEKTNHSKSPSQIYKYSLFTVGN